MLRILDITAPDICNGNGCRVTIWVAGCKHHCKGCHNQWTWDFNKGIVFNDNKNDIYSQLSEWLSKDYIEGLTFSGGDPLCQDTDGLNSILEIIDWVRKNYESKNIWLYTGYEYEYFSGINIKPTTRLQKKVIDSVDVLVDGPYVEEKRDVCHTPFRGSTNQRIIYIFNK